MKKHEILELVEDKALQILAKGFNNHAIKQDRQIDLVKYRDDGIPTIIVTVDGVSVEITLLADFVNKPSAVS